jgi:hypothetical protein
MGKPTSAPPAHDADVLDETDPHAGDDAEWVDDDLAAVAAEPASLLFWKGLLLGLLLSVVAWCLLAAVAIALSKAASSL